MICWRCGKKVAPPEPYIKGEGDVLCYKCWLYAPIDELKEFYKKGE